MRGITNAIIMMIGVISAIVLTHRLWVMVTK